MGNVVNVLNTANGETGTGQSLKNRELLGGKGTYVDFEIASGDTVVFEGKLTSANSYKTILTVTANALVLVDLPVLYRGRRTVNGAVGNSTINIQTPDITGVV